MTKFKEYTNDELVALFQKDKAQAIEVLFRNYYKYVCGVLYPVLKEREVIEDIAQDVFYDLWRKKDRLEITTSLSAYLKRAAINKALNHIRDQKMKFDEYAEMPKMLSKELNAQRQIEVHEMELLVKNSIEQLPEKCRIIFSLSRYEKMSYREIAKHLDISVKTVENQISKALKELRIHLGPFMNTINVSLLAFLTYC